MSDEKRTLAYRYRLRLTPSQEDDFDRSQQALRLVWNHFVRSQRHAEREWQHGRTASVKNELMVLSLAKKASGQAIASARKIATDRNVSFDEALQLMRREFVEKVAKIPVSKKNGSRLLRIARRKLATQYSDVVVNSKVDHYYSLSSWTCNALRDKFQKCSEMWVKGKFRRPRFKRRGEPVALQKEITKNSPFSLERFSDLATFGGQALKRCEIIIHRPLPANAEVKQIAVTGVRGGRHLVVMFNAPAFEVAKDFPVTNRTVGIDPGIKVGLTLTPLDSPDFGKSDSFRKEPKLARDIRFLKRLRRLQRKHDRQRRACNPTCFDTEGRWIKGKRANNESANMVRTQATINAMHTHLSESRRDFYHNAACEILRSFDNVAVGAWRPAQTRRRKPTTPSAKGLGAARRAVNRTTYDNAISLFIGYLKDKANRSTTPKQVQDVSEARSTRDCPQCGQSTGPTGAVGLNVREWACPKCGGKFLRDAAAAWQIAKRFSTEVASTSQSAESQDPAQKRRRQRRSQVPVADEALPVRDAIASAVETSQKPPVASGHVTGQASSGARASLLPVTAVGASASCAGDTPDTLRKQDTLAIAAGATSGSTTRNGRRRRA